MIKKFSYWHLVIILCLSLSLLAVGGCTKTSAAKPLRVAAAADLTLVFQEIAKNFEKINGTKVDLLFGSTGTLAQQIENGAPFDVFAAADIKFVDKLKNQGLIINETQQLYARGTIGLATKVTSPFLVKEPKDLLKPEIKKIAIANPEHAPYGMAAKEALEKAGLWEQVKNKMVYGKNIQDTLTLINTGNADAGIIALSIARKAEVNFSLIKSDLYKPLNQSMAVIAATRQEQSARKFIEYVNSLEGRTVMKKYGFVLPGEDNYSD